MDLNDIYAVIEARKASIPVDVKALAAELGIDVVERSMKDEISGYIKKLSDNKYKIIVNSTHPVNRRRFTVAHEIGHFLFDADVLDKNQICDEKLFRSSGCSNVDQDRETRANRFAASILMPTSKVKEHAESATNIMSLALAFKVSDSAMKLRLHSLGITDLR